MLDGLQQCNETNSKMSSMSQGVKIGPCYKHSCNFDLRVL